MTLPALRQSQRNGSTSRPIGWRRSTTAWNSPLNRCLFFACADHRAAVGVQAAAASRRPTSRPQRAVVFRAHADAGAGPRRAHCHQLPTGRVPAAARRAIEGGRARAQHPAPRAACPSGRRGLLGRAARRAWSSDAPRDRARASRTRCGCRLLVVGHPPAQRPDPVIPASRVRPPSRDGPSQADLANRAAGGARRGCWKRQSRPRPSVARLSGDRFAERAR
jgi:hypothetical protein